MRLGPGELDRIVDDSIARKGWHPLGEYILFLQQLDLKYPQEKSRKVLRFGNQKPN